LRGRDVPCARFSRAGPGQGRQDRRDPADVRRHRLDRGARQGGARGRNGHHQQRSSRARHSAAGQERRPCGPRRRQDRDRVRRQPGQPGVTLTSSAIAEKYGIPFLNSESVAANLTERGFKWFFRTTPIATDFAKAYVDFLADIKAQGAKTDAIALVHDNTEYGTSVANTISAAFKEKGQVIAVDVAYPVNATDVQGQVLQLKEKKPDVIIMISYTSDAILFAKTMQSLDYKPAVLLADDAGYSDPSFIKAVGKISQGVFNRSSWSVGPAGSPSAIIADMYKKKSGEEMDDTVGRQMQGFFVLADAIDRAGSTDPAKIQAALKTTDLKPEQLMMGYKGVKFDDKGQNILASGLIIQLQDGENYTAVWPKANAAKAPVLPYKGW
jgi:branched-chain amino acid transport system substrate-binding protein